MNDSEITVYQSADPSSGLGDVVQDGATADYDGDAEDIQTSVNVASGSGDVVQNGTTTEYDGDAETIRTEVQIEKGPQERLRLLKNAQTSALSKVSRKRTELSQLMSSDNNVNTVQEKLDEYNVLYQNYQECYHSHCEQTDDGESKRFDTNESSILNFRVHVQDWIFHTEQRLQDDLDRASSKRSSHSSHTSMSSRRNSHLEIKARLAELLVEKSAMAQQQEIEFKKQALQLEVDIAKAQAREKTFTQYELECTSVVNVPISNTTSYVTPKKGPIYTSSHIVDATGTSHSSTVTVSGPVSTSRHAISPGGYNATTCVSNVTSLSQSTAVTYSNVTPKVHSYIWYTSSICHTTRTKYSLVRQQPVLVVVVVIH